MFQTSKVYLLLATLLFSFILNGCAAKANFQNTPIQQSEFKKDIKVLKSAYSDIEEYDRYFALPQNSPKMSELQKIWGKSEENNLWLGYIVGWTFNIALVASGLIPYAFLAVPALLMPVPQKEYIWEKERYHITVKSRNGLMVRYEERLRTWDWEEIKK